MIRERLVIGLTGGIGAGKSLALKAFARGGARTVDCDKIARDQAKPGRPGFRALRRAFGRGVLGPKGAIDRAKLADLVFSNPGRRVLLEAATHPSVLREMRRRVRESRGVVVVDVPLLFEKRLEGLFDATVLVTAPKAERLARLARRGLPRSRALGRMAAQLSDSAKAALADIVVPNGRRRADLCRRIKRYCAAFQLMQESPI